MKFLIINGPNINMLGIREKGIYGNESYDMLLEKIKNHCEKLSVEHECFQSNCEGEIVSKIQQAFFKGVDGIVINPAAYTHTSIAILDALKAVDIPTVEVHISDISKREEFRKHSFVSTVCKTSFIGLGTEGYIKAIDYLNQNKQEN